MHSNDLRPRPEKQVVAVFRAVPPNAQVFGVISETVFLFRHQSILHMIPLNLSERPLLLIKSWGMVIAVVLSLASQPLLAQQSAVYDQLVKISELMIDQGYSKSHDFEVDYLNEDATDEYNITLQKGVTYKIIAVCDNDCDYGAKGHNNNKRRKNTRYEKRKKLPAKQKKNTHTHPPRKRVKRKIELSTAWLTFTDSYFHGKEHKKTRTTKEGKK